MTTYDVSSRPFGEPTPLDGPERAFARRDSAPIRGILFGLAIVAPIWIGAGIGVVALLSL
jgi:hypothetical protein